MRWMARHDRAEGQRCTVNRTEFLGTRSTPCGRSRAGPDHSGERLLPAVAVVGGAVAIRSSGQESQVSSRLCGNTEATSGSSSSVNRSVFLGRGVYGGEARSAPPGPKRRPPLSTRRISRSAWPRRARGTARSWPRRDPHWRRRAAAPGGRRRPAPRETHCGRLAYHGRRAVDADDPGAAPPQLLEARPIAAARVQHHRSKRQAVDHPGNEGIGPLREAPVRLDARRQTRRVRVLLTQPGGVGSRLCGHRPLRTHRPS